MFDYPVPKLTDLRKMYKTPYRFSEELQEEVDYIFRHPYNTHNELYVALRKDSDPNDMIKRAYLIVRYYLDYPQQFGNSLDNIVPHILVDMWKSFLSRNKRIRNVEFDKYLKLRLSKLLVTKDKFLDKLLEDIRKENYIKDYRDMRKKQGRGKAKGGVKEKMILYYESLDGG